MKDSEGNLVNDCLSFIGGSLDGVRKSQTVGNAGGNKSITFFPPKSDTYTWGVQTVNAAYHGSTFAVGDSFTFEDSGVSHITTDDASGEQHFSVMGLPIDAREPGIHIVKKNGRYVKQVVR